MSTLVIPEGLEPLAVWDCNGPGGPWHSGDHDVMWEASDWAVRNIPYANSTYRVEFYVFDVLFAVVYRYARNADGKVIIDLGTCGPVKEEPAIVPLAGLPPAYLLRA